MRYRPLGRTGQFVSEICLGTMTFDGGAGFWRNIGTRRAEGATALVAARAGRRRQFHRHRRRLFRRPVGGHARPGAARPQGHARGRDRRHQGARPHRAGPQRRRPVARPHHGPDRRQPEAAAARLCRPLPDPRLRSRHADGGDPARARRLRHARARAHDRLLQPGGLADHEGAGRSPSGAASRASRRCRPITPSPAATSSARSCRWSRTRASA